MKISPRMLVIAGLAVFLCGVVALFPARAAYQWFAPAEIQLSGISGTVWTGRASEGQASGLYLRDLEWTISPSALLRGVLRVDLRVSPAGGFLDSRIDLHPSGDVTFTDLAAGLSMDALRGALPLSGIEGNIRLQLSYLTIEDGFPSSAEGSGEVMSLLVRPLFRAPLGSYRVRFTGAEDGIMGSIEDIDGVFDIAGTIKLDSARNYELRGLVVPTGEAPADLVRQLQFLGSPNERGQREFRLEGAL